MARRGVSPPCIVAARMVRSDAMDDRKLAHWLFHTAHLQTQRPRIHSNTDARVLTSQEIRGAGAGVGGSSLSVVPPSASKAGRPSHQARLKGREEIVAGMMKGRKKLGKKKPKPKGRPKQLLHHETETRTGQGRFKPGARQLRTPAAPLNLPLMMPMVMPIAMSTEEAIDVLAHHNSTMAAQVQVRPCF